MSRANGMRFAQNRPLPSNLFDTINPLTWRITVEIDITDFFENACPRDYSASVAELGVNAGSDTWRAACDDSPDYPFLDTEEKREEFREHIRGFGAWNDDEIKAWSDTELNALLLQLISGEMRESGLDQGEPDWQEYREGCEAGKYHGDISPGNDGRVYFYVGD